MNKNELIQYVTEDTGLKKKDVRAVLQSILQASTKALQKDEPVTMIGFGTFHPWKQTSRPARNPKTGEPVMLAPRTSVKFRAGLKLLKDLNK
ncbi:HU family DNA-binding protein [uncultured Parabacteroides sp.]|uniref:HU family DNA-binding protein n=1 Tax=uncultured Parabacteroides sp. TaxID=512312 RepID=UPI0025891858|nr:HU family DNA-binding protein [uncultured Parabacteroides sp.]